MMRDVQTQAQIRAILRDHARLKQNADQVDSQADLYALGMTSQASVNVMLALEGAFGLEFPDHMLKRHVFASVTAIEQALAELGAA